MDRQVFVPAGAARRAAPFRQNRAESVKGATVGGARSLPLQTSTVLIPTLQLTGGFGGNKNRFPLVSSEHSVHFRGSNRCFPVPPFLPF